MVSIKNGYHNNSISPYDVWLLTWISQHVSNQTSYGGMELLWLPFLIDSYTTIVEFAKLGEIIQLVLCVNALITQNKFEA